MADEKTEYSIEEMLLYVDLCSRNLNIELKQARKAKNANKVDEIRQLRKFEESLAKLFLPAWYYGRDENGWIKTDTLAKASQITRRYNQRKAKKSGNKIS